jgi:tetratricopeptide (TPR) repeat protein
MTAPSEQELEALQSAELIRLVSSEPDIEYLFRHALLQDAAYNLLLRSERQRLHRSVGDVLERLYPDRRAELAAVLAHHFEAAEEWDRAVEYLVLAGRQALARFANREARDLLDRAAAHLEASKAGSDLARRVEIGLGRARAGFSFVPFDENLALLEETLGCAEELGDDHLLAAVHLQIGRVRHARGESYATSPKLRASLDEAVRIGAALGQDSVRALPLRLIGSARLASGDHVGAIEALEEALPILESIEDHGSAALAAGTLGRARARAGDFAAARRATESAFGLAERSGDPNVTLDIQIFAGVVAAEQGNLEEAMRLTREGVRLADEVGNTYCSLGGNFYLGDPQLRLNALDDAAASIERSRELAEFCDAGSIISLSDAWMGAARASVAGDDLSAFEAPLHHAKVSDDRYGASLVLQLRARARAAQPDPDWEHSIRDLTEAADGLEELGARPSLARVLGDLSEALAAAGRDKEAADALARSEELARAMELTPEPAAF